MADHDNNGGDAAASNRGGSFVRGGAATNDGNKLQDKWRFSNANFSAVPKGGGFRPGVAVACRAPFRVETMASLRRSVAELEENPEQMKAFEERFMRSISRGRRSDAVVLAEHFASSDGGFDTNCAGWQSPIVERSSRKNVSTVGGTSAAELTLRVAAESVSMYGSAVSTSRSAKRSSDEMSVDDVFLPKPSNKCGGAKSEWNPTGTPFVGKFGGKKFSGRIEHLKLTGNISDVLDWHSHGDKLQLEFEIYGKGASPVWIGYDKRRKEFVIKDLLNTELRVHFYEIDRPIPTINATEWMRFTGIRRFTGEFQVTSIDCVNTEELFDVKSMIRNSRRLLESELARLENAGSKA